MACPRRNRHRNQGFGFTIVEILVVLGVIVLLAGLLLPALNAVRKTGLMTKSMSNMKQVGTWMRLYSSDNREYIVPSQFDYSNNPNPGNVRSSDEIRVGQKHKGSWADIIWTQYHVASLPSNATDAGGTPLDDYRYDSPDAHFYEQLGGWDDNPLRSAGQVSRDAPGAAGANSLPTPHGPGARHAGQPGYFAANNFFNTDEDSPNYDPSENLGWVVNGQIKAPDRSMYLVDSVAGETIEDEPDPFFNDAQTVGNRTLEVDFRYPGPVCLMLFLDGHVDPVGEWIDLANLEDDRNIKVRELHRR